MKKNGDLNLYNLKEHWEKKYLPIITSLWSLASNADEEIKKQDSRLEKDWQKVQNIFKNYIPDFEKLIDFYFLNPNDLSLNFESKDFNNEKDKINQSYKLKNWFSGFKKKIPKNI